MKVREFLEAVRARLEAGGHDGLTTTIAFSYVQAHFGDRRVHFECWVQRRTGLLELGLHFEGPREFSHAWAAAIGEHMPELVAALGDGIELEEWTERWTRLHETRPFVVGPAKDGRLTEALAGEAAARLTAYIVALRPLLAALAPSIADPAPVAGRQRR